jgi:hypothetical protein
VSLPTRVASIFGLGVTAVMFVATVLVLLGIFGRVVLAVLLALVAAGSWTVGLRRSRLSEHAAAVRAEVRAEPFLALVFLLLLVASVAWAAVAVLPSAGGWRYWADGLELADVGGIPSFTAQWGEALSPAVSKLGGNAFLGTLSFLFGDHPFTGMAVALWLSAVGYAVGLFALAYELGLRWTAAVVALLGIAASPLPGDVVLNADVVSKLEFYQHEDLGRMLATVGAALVLARGRTGPSRTQMAAGGSVLAAAGLTHLIPLVAFGALVAGALVVRFALGPRRREIATLAGVAACAAVFLIAAPLALAGGEVGFSGATQPGSYTLVEGRYDPTARVKGLTLDPRPKSEARWYQAPGTTARLAAEASLGRSLSGSAAGVVALAFVAVAAVIFALGTTELRSLVGGAVAMAVGLLGAGLFFSFHYTLWAQGTFGERRLFEYASVPLMLIGVAGLELVAQRLERRWRLAGRTVALAAIVGALIASIGDLGVADQRAPMRYVAAAATTPCDSRLLVDRVTRGTFQALAGRISITEGLVPFLRPTLVNDVLALRRDTRAFFEDPENASDILAREEVDFVLSATRAKLRSASALRLVDEVDGVSVYEVQDSETSDMLPRPTESAGYDCVERPAP